MREIELKLKRKIKARLYLNAVLPAFEDLLDFSEDARAHMHGRKFKLGFQTSSGLKSTLIFENGTCQFTKTKQRQRQIVLHFVSEEQLNREFEDEGFRLPIPIKGATRVGDLKAFKAVSTELEKCLRPSQEKLDEVEFHAFHVGLQLGIALRAAIELATHEPLSKNIMGQCPSGLAFFSVGKDGYGAWLLWESGRLTSGKGTPERKPDVTVEFQDAETALRAVGNRIDVMAAVGLGEIKVSGLVPLADSLGYIFERIPLYIQP